LLHLPLCWFAAVSDHTPQVISALELSEYSSTARSVIPKKRGSTQTYFVAYFLRIPSPKESLCGNHEVQKLVFLPMAVSRFTEAAGSCLNWITSFEKPPPEPHELGYLACSQMIRLPLQESPPWWIHLGESCTISRRLSAER
jgi:hypothetical protein